MTKVSVMSQIIPYLNFNSGEWAEISGSFSNVSNYTLLKRMVFNAELLSAKFQ